MLKYVLKRLLVMLPTLFAILLLSFIISRNVPGDPILTEMENGNRPGSLNSRETRLSYYKVLSHEKGYDLPLFYFSLHALAYSDTIHKVVNLSERAGLEALVGQYGNWPQVEDYFRSVCIADEKANQLQLDRSEKETFDPARLAILELRSLSNAEEIAFRMELLDTLVATVPRFAELLGDEVKAIQMKYAKMQETASSWKLYIPNLSFHGLNNQFHHWLGSIIRMDFGKSYIDKRKVTEKIKESLPWTIFMGFFSFLISYLVAIPVGVYSVQKRNQWQDKGMTVGLFLMHSVPSFVTAMLLMTLVCNPEYFYIFPTTGVASDNADNWPFFDRMMDYAWHLTLPTLVYSYGAIAFVSRQMRVGMLENINMDYIRTARAKGLSENAVIWKHALRNSLLPILTNFSGFFPHLIAGSVIIETIFSIPGMGRLTIQAVSAFDHPVLLAVFTLSAIATLIGILVTDLLYVLVDPRISFSKQK